MDFIYSSIAVLSGDDARMGEGGDVAEVCVLVLLLLVVVVVVLELLYVGLLLLLLCADVLEVVKLSFSCISVVDVVL